MRLRGTFSLSVLLLSLTGLLHAQDQDDEDREGGIVGTGIVGVVTELGSIRVNGQRIVFDPELRVTGGVKQRTAADLVPGNTVAVVAVEESPDWRAQSIRNVIPIAGPVAELDATSLTIMGSQIDARATGTAGIARGDRVAINGFWEEDKVVATLIQPLSASDPDMVSGSLLGESSSGGLTIGGTQISGIKPEHIQQGDAVRAIGLATSAGLKAESLVTGIFDGAVGVVQAAGYLSAPAPSGLYSLLGSGLVAYTDNPSMIDPTETTVRCGVDGRLLGAEPEAQELPEELRSSWRALNCDQ